MAKILIVDDRPPNREFLVALLGYRGHRLLKANDGAEGLAIARAEHPDLVIADVLMPTMDGYEFVRQLRADRSIAQTPVIFYTAHYHEREARALATSCGVSSVITKPSEPEVVLAAVDAALGEAAPESAAPDLEEFDREHLRLLTDKLSEKSEALRATNDRLSAMIELNLQLASELDLQRLLQTFGHATREIIGARYAITGVLSGDGSRFRSLFTSGMDAETAARLGAPDPKAPTIRTVLLENRTIRLQNRNGDPVALGLPSSHPAVHSWIGAPIASPTRVYGFIGLIDKLGSDEFTSEDERLAGILAAQVGRIYQNGSLYAEVLTHASDLEREIAAREQTERALAERMRCGSLIGDIGSILTRTDTAPEALHLCVESLVRHLDLAGARIWTVAQDGFGLELRASVGILDPAPRIRIARIAQERELQYANDVLSGTWLTDREWARREGITAFAGYPMIVEDRLAGVLVIFARHPLEMETVNAVGAVAQQIALGIEHKQSEHALREREEHIRLLLDSTAEAIYGIDMRGRCTFANAACARMLRYENAGELLGRDMHELIHHTRPDGIPYPGEECKIFLAFRKNEGSHVDDEMMWRSDGTGFPAEYWSYPVNRDGKLVGAVVTFLDLTERRQLETQYRQAQQRLRHIVGSSPAVLLTISFADQHLQAITWISNNLRDIFGHASEIALGSEWWLNSIHPEDLERVRAQSDSELFSRGYTTQEYRFRHGKGEYRWTRCDMRLVYDEQGQPSEVVGAWLDITDRKRAEEEQSKLREQLLRAQKLETVGQLAGGVAHDFNNLLTVINGYSALLLKKLNEDDPMHESLTEIRIAGERAAALSQQLLLFSRKQVLQPKWVNPNEIVREVERMLDRVLGEDIHIESILDRSLGSVMADPGQLHQVLMNLAVNARDAMPNGGKLLIETENIDIEAAYAGQHPDMAPGHYVRLKVTDTGEGMTADVLSHLFEPFFTTKQPGKGTGLGLATIYGIVKESGGSISVYSEPGEGTTFTIYLPRVSDTADDSRVEKPAPVTLRGTETILIVEDQEQVLTLARRTLTECGYQVLEAASPDEALAHCEQYPGPIHLMLTDVVMPGMTGPDLAGRVRPLRPSMQVIFMSGYSERAIRHHRSVELAGRYISKPFSPDALALKVKEALVPPRPTGAVLVVDDEPAARKFIREILVAAGYSVVEAQNGKEALEKIENTHIDLMITDLAMPEQEGIETIQMLRRKHSQISIIAMSGIFSTLLRGAEHLGAQASISKPIREEELLTLVARVLRGEGSS